MKTHIFYPIARRMGTFLAGVVASKAALMPETVVAVEAAIVAGILVACDLINSWAERR